MNNYRINVDLKFGDLLEAKDEKEAKKKIKEVFKETFGIELMDFDIKSIEKV